jgi:hypothetical protein
VKQPHEGIAGVDREDWLLDLDTRAMAHRDALAAMGLHLQRASTVGNPAPIVKEIWNRISESQIGDLVVEATYWFPNRDEDHRAKSLGILVEKRREWACSDEEWARWEAEDPDAYDGERPIERDAWYIQYGSSAADVCRWTNCMFVTVPIKPDEFRQ